MIITTYICGSYIERVIYDQSLPLNTNSTGTNGECIKVHGNCCLAFAPFLFSFYFLAQRCLK